VKALRTFLLSVARDGFLTLQDEVGASKRFEKSLREIENVSFEMGLLPERYRRNGETISVDQQRKLFESCVAVVGCGGLGGYVLEELARLGVGTIRAIDPDVFEEHNLNRQILSTALTMGQTKVEAARDRVAAINPAVEVIALRETLSLSNSSHLLRGAHVVVDGLDSIHVRVMLAKACTDLVVPLIHGSIAGWYGQVITQFPGDGVIEAVYGRAEADRGIEVVMGNPAFTPAVVASLQSAEACKVLLGEGKPLRKTMLFINLLDMDIERIVIPSE
jgi:molybdopterin-synthase adenylyltransferase